jgi:hypothetical protein
MSAFLSGLPSPPLTDSSGRFTPAWAGWFSNAQQILQDLSNSGTTAQRPTSVLYVGKRYFDTTLGTPIFLKAVSPTVVWVNGIGTAV